MDKRLHDKLIEDMKNLKSLLAKCSTVTVVGMVAAKFIRWPAKDIELSSPHRQLFYLLGLMLSTPEPTNPQEYDESAWNDSADLLERIFFAYAWMFWPTAEEARHLNKEWKDVRKIAMPAFLNYFNSGLLASTEQVKDRIKRYILPYDSAVKDMFGLSATDMLEIADFIGQQMQADYDSLSNLIKKEEQARHVFQCEAETKNWDFQTIRRKVEHSSYGEVAQALFSALGKVSTILFGHLQDKFGSEKADIFLQTFGDERGSVEELSTYMTKMASLFARYPPKI
jgi:hypothetical protein